MIRGATAEMKEEEIKARLRFSPHTMFCIWDNNCCLVLLVRDRVYCFLFNKWFLLLLLFMFLFFFFFFKRIKNKIEKTWELRGFRIKWGIEESFWVWFFLWQRGKVKEEEEEGKELPQSERDRFLSPSWYIPTLLHTHSLSSFLFYFIFFNFIF